MFYLVGAFPPFADNSYWVIIPRWTRDINPNYFSIAKLFSSLLQPSDQQMSRPSLNTCSFLTHPPATPACLKMHKPFHSLPLKVSRGDRERRSERSRENRRGQSTMSPPLPPRSISRDERRPWTSAELCTKTVSSSATRRGGCRLCTFPRFLSP